MKSQEANSRRLLQEADKAPAWPGGGGEGSQDKGSPGRTKSTALRGCTLGLRKEKTQVSTEGQGLILMRNQNQFAVRCACQE